MNRKLQLLGEPAAIIAAVQAILAVAVSFGWLSVIGIDGQDALAVVMVAVNAIGAVVVAYTTRDTLLAPVVELFKALLSVGAIYGLHITTEQTGLVVVVITAVFGLFNRQSTSPLVNGSFALAA
jgi:hypothetical protein